MDKYEYKVRAEEIKQLIARGEYPQAAEIADTIDWRRVKSVMMLCTISDLYKINRRYEEARDLLLMAYDRRPNSRSICYSLCELSIKTGEFVQAVEYYKEKWVYELAYLYHKIGLGTRCVEECDELIMMMGSGRYVTKAMELKMLHEPLTPQQQEKYDHRNDMMKAREQLWAEPESESETPVPIPEQSAEPPIEQANAAEAVPEEPAQPEQPIASSVGGDTQIYEPVRMAHPESAHEAAVSVVEEPQSEPESAAAEEEAAPAESVQPTAEPQTPEQPDQEYDIHVKTMKVGQYDTLNLQAELAHDLKEFFDKNQHEETVADSVTRSIVAPMLETDDTESLDGPEIDVVDPEDLEPEPEQMESTEVFFGATGEIAAEEAAEPEGSVGEPAEPEIAPEQELPAEPEYSAEPEEEAAELPIQEQIQESAAEPEPVPEDTTGRLVMEQMRRDSVTAAQPVILPEPPKEIAHVLSQESDGQISMVLPETGQVEKQITGQLSIEDILAEWERVKRANEEKRREEVRQHVLQTTGPMFTEFEAAVRDEILAKTPGEGIEPAADGIADGMEEITEEAAEGSAEAAMEGAVEATAEEATEETIKEATKEAIKETTEEISEIETEAEPELESIETEPLPIEPEPTAESGDTTAEPEESDADGFVWDEIGDAFEEIEEPEAADDEEAEPEEPEEAEEPEEPEGSEESEEAAEETEKTDETEEIKESEGAEQTEEPEEAGADETAAAQDAEDEDDSDEEDEDEENEDESSRPKVRALTREEKELYAPFIQSRKAREQIATAIDNISMAAYIGNLIVTGEEGMDTMTLAKNMIREVQSSDSNFSGRVAKISGQALNKKDVAATLEQLHSGALIIQRASDMKEETAKALYEALQRESLGIVVVLEDNRKAMNRFLRANAQLREVFTARVDVEAMSNDTLVAFGRQYARELEYSISDLGILELHRRIEDLQTFDHIVTAPEVKKIMDDAIRHANRKTPGHFFDVLFNKRYDDEDMIILTDKDFI